jgi:hypothetical protein
MFSPRFFFYLIFRLISYERNQNFGKIETLEPEYTMTLPDATTYADVNSDSKFPKTELSNVQTFLAQHEKSLDKRIKRLYNEQFLRYFRMSLTITQDKNDIVFHLRK